MHDRAPGDERNCEGESLGEHIAWLELAGVGVNVHGLLEPVLEPLPEIDVLPSIEPEEIAHEVGVSLFEHFPDDAVVPVFLKQLRRPDGVDLLPGHPVSESKQTGPVQFKLLEPGVISLLHGGLDITADV